jgi:tetratricopeptide (TPR) repeat protein
LADLYEAMKKPELANKIYERVLPTSPLQRNAQIQLAMNLDTLDHKDEAKAHLEKLIAANPGGVEAIMALGNVRADGSSLPMRRYVRSFPRSQKRKNRIGPLLFPWHLL